MSDDEQPEPSALGTKEFWDKCYENELKNFEESGQEGEIWFGKRTEKRIVDFIIDSKTLSDCQIIDVGCGNGSLLRSLRSKGYRNLAGIDCCDAAVKLADAIAQQGRKSDQADILFATVDVLSSSPSSDFSHKFDLALDKGTYDAISLSEDKESRLELYRKFIVHCLKQTDSRFVICSCNFTLDELKSQFCPVFEFVTDVPSPASFTFGGKSGNPTTVAVFRPANSLS